MGLLSTQIKSLDFFGHPVRFSFNKKGDSHNTIVGGLFSVLILIGLAFYFSILVKRLIYFEDDRLSTEILSQNATLLGEVPWKNMSVTLFMGIVQFGGEYGQIEPLGYDDKLRKYIKIYQQNYQIDLEEKGMIGSLAPKKVEIKDCTREEFGATEKLESLYDSLNVNFKLVCMPQLNEWNLRNFETSVDYSSFAISFESCNNATSDIVCESPENITEFIRSSSIHFYGIFDQVDFSLRDPDTRPTFQQMKVLKRFQLSESEYTEHSVYLEENKIETYDDYISLGFPSFTDSYYDLGSAHEFKSSMTQGHAGSGTVYYSINLYLSDQYKKHTRKIYGLLDLLGDMGGVLEISTAFFGILIFPLSRHSFFLKALEQLFLARTSDPRFFDRTNSGGKNSKRKYLAMKEEMPEDYSGTKLESEAATHRPIRLSCWKRTRLFCIKLPLGCCLLSNRQTNRLKRLKDRGEEALEKELSLERLLKQARDLRIFFKRHVFARNPFLRFDIQHSHQNLLDIDTTDSDNSASSSDLVTSGTKKIDRRRIFEHLSNHLIERTREELRKRIQTYSQVQQEQKELVQYDSDQDEDDVIKIVPWKEEKVKVIDESWSPTRRRSSNQNPPTDKKRIFTNSPPRQSQPHHKSRDSKASLVDFYNSPTESVLQAKIKEDLARQRREKNNKVSFDSASVTASLVDFVTNDQLISLFGFPPSKLPYQRTTESNTQESSTKPNKSNQPKNPSSFSKQAKPAKSPAKQKPTQVEISKPSGSTELQRYLNRHYKPSKRKEGT